MAGVGAIGGFLAARLALAGWPVTALARGETLRVLESGPLIVVDDGEEIGARIDAVASAADAGPVDLALVASKSYDTQEVASSIAAALAPDATVLSLQNGVHNAETLALGLPGVSVAPVAVYMGCQRVAPNRIVRRPSRDRATGLPRDRLVGAREEAAGRALSEVGRAAGVAVELVDDIEVALWTKLVANVCLNTVTALARARVGTVFDDPGAVTLMLDLGREVEAVAHAAGVSLPEGAASAYVADARRRLPADGGSSTLFDLEAGRRLEYEAMVGSVARDGERLGVPVPVSRTCAALLGLLDPARPVR